MGPSLRMFWANSSTATKVIGTPLFAVFSAMLLMTCAGFMGQTFSASYTNLGEGFFAVCAGIVGALFVLLIIAVVVLLLLLISVNIYAEYCEGNNNIKRVIRVLCLSSALFFVANLSSEHGIFWHIYMEIQTSMDGGFVALCSALTGAAFVNLFSAYAFAIFLLAFGSIIRGVALFCFD